MPQRQIPVPPAIAMRMHIAILQRDLAQTQARLMQSMAEQQHLTTLGALLAEAQILLPVPLTQCAFDADRGVLLYEDPTPTHSASAE